MGKFDFSKEYNEAVANSFNKDSILEMISNLKIQNAGLKEELEYYANGYSIEIPKIYWFVMAIFAAAVFYLGFVTMSACAAEGVVGAEIVEIDNLDSSETRDALPEDIDPAQVDSIDGKYSVVNF